MLSELEYIEAKIDLRFTLKCLCIDIWKELKFLRTAMLLFRLSANSQSFRRSHKKTSQLKNLDFRSTCEALKVHVWSISWHFNVQYLVRVRFKLNWFEHFVRVAKVDVIYWIFFWTFSLPGVTYNNIWTKVINIAWQG